MCSSSEAIRQEFLMCISGPILSRINLQIAEKQLGEQLARPRHACPLSGVHVCDPTVKRNETKRNAANATRPTCRPAAVPLNPFRSVPRNKSQADRPAGPTAAAPRPPPPRRRRRYRGSVHEAEAEGRGPVASRRVPLSEAEQSARLGDRTRAAQRGSDGAAAGALRSAPRRAARLRSGAAQRRTIL